MKNRLSIFLTCYDELIYRRTDPILRAALLLKKCKKIILIKETDRKFISEKNPERFPLYIFFYLLWDAGMRQWTIFT